MEVTKLHEFAKLPVKAYPTDAGFDLSSVIETTVLDGNITKVNTGISVKIPEGYYGRIAPRSGLAAKHGIHVLAGVIDYNYTGEIIVLLTSLKKNNTFEVKVGDKIAQLILEKISDINECKWVDSNSTNSVDLPKLTRNNCGFGSSG